MNPTAIEANCGTNLRAQTATRSTGKYTESPDVLNMNAFLLRWSFATNYQNGLSSLVKLVQKHLEMCWKVLLLAKETSLRRRQRCAPLLARRCRTNAMFSTEPSLNGRISVQKIFRLNMTVHSALRSATP